MSRNLYDLIGLAAGICFILALKGLSSPKSARRGNLIGAVGAIVVADHAKTNLELGLALAAVILATINMVGGFVVTDRMLQMFKGKPKSKKDSGEAK